MGKGRIEAFSDGVFAVIITITVLELKIPHGSDLTDLAPLYPLLFAYFVSFTYVGIYWNNHHHLIHTVKRPTAGIMWGNLHLLFWLSLFPFTTAWVGENRDAAWPAALYGFVLLGAAFAYTMLQKAIIRADTEITVTSLGAEKTGGAGELAEAIGADYKGKLSLVLYLAGIGLSFVRPWLGELLYVSAAVMWVIPDRRIERQVARE